VVRAFSVRTRYRAGVTHGGGPPVVAISISPPTARHVPLNVGQPAPSSVNVPSAAKCAEKPANRSGIDGGDCDGGGALSANATQTMVMSVLIIYAGSNRSARRYPP